MKKVFPIINGSPCFQIGGVATFQAVGPDKHALCFRFCIVFENVGLIFNFCLHRLLPQLFLQWLGSVNLQPESFVLNGVAIERELKAYWHASGVAGDQGDIVFKQSFQQPLSDGDLLVVEHHHS